MVNLANDIDQNCTECNTEQKLNYLFRKGFISYIPESYLEISNFYNSLIKAYGKGTKSKRRARLDTQLHFKINKRKFYRILQSVS